MCIRDRVNTVLGAGRVVWSRADVGDAVTLAISSGLTTLILLAGNWFWQPRVIAVPLSLIHILPSRAEALAVVNVEALAMGTPVVGARVGGIGEAVRDSVDGFLVPPNDPATTAERIGQLLADPDLRRRMSAAARQGFLEQRELAANMGRQADWYEQLVGEKR